MGVKGPKDYFSALHPKIATKPQAISGVSSFWAHHFARNVNATMDLGPRMTDEDYRSQICLPIEKADCSSENA